jgi:hypothetical protein
MFWTDWTLRIGEGEMGGFVKDTLYQKRNDNQPQNGNFSAPDAPAGVTASGGIGILIDWNNNLESDLAGYSVYRSTTAGGGYVKQNSSLLTASDYTDVNISAGTTYYYVVKAVDTGGLESVYSTEVSASSVNPPLGTGAILREWWNDIPEDYVFLLTDNANYPDNPSGRQLITKLQGPTNWADDYGTRIRGFLNPVTSGTYSFWIASSGESELVISSDTDPYNICWFAYVAGYTDPCQWDKYSSQQSSAAQLVAGQKYYIEVRHKAGEGSDNLAVAWQGPGISQQVIDGIYLSPYGLKFVDFAGFAANWNRTDCDISNGWCSGNDFSQDGAVGIDDMEVFADSWLAGI